MRIEELNEIIALLKEAQTDTSFVEIKSCAGGFPKRIWETLSSFSNTAGGGIIIFGIEEKEQGIEIVGIKEPAKFLKNLQETCSQMTPPVRALIEIHKVAGKMLVTAEIPEISYREKPCFYNGSGMISGSFIRVGESDRKLTQYEIQGFLDGRGQPQYDTIPIPESSNHDLDQKALHLFLSHIKENNFNVRGWSDEKILQGYRVLISHEGKDVVTLAGLLCFGSYPQQFFPSLATHVLVFPQAEEGQPGPKGERFLDNVKVEGSLLTAVPEIIKVIKRNIQKRSMIKGLFREDVLEYPEVFLREAVTNALGHRDYSPLAQGTAVQIKIFPNRIEIISPGGLFGPVTVEKLGESGLQAARNSHLMKLLEDSPVSQEGKVLCENRGTGILAMIDALRRAGMEPPQFINSMTQFKVVCSNQALFEKATLSWLEKYAHINLNDRQRFALAYLHHKGKLTNQDYTRMNECDSRVATKELSELAKEKLVVQHGTRRWAYYTLFKETEQKQFETAIKRERPLRKDRRKDIIAVIKKRGECSRQELKGTLHLSSQIVLHWLRKLLKEGSLEPTTKSLKNPNVKYRLKK